MPTSFLLGRDGKVRFVHEGFHGDRTESELRRQIEALLAGHPKIADVAVVGIEDAKVEGEQVVTAVVVPRPALAYRRLRKTSAGIELLGLSSSWVVGITPYFAKYSLEKRIEPTAPDRLPRAVDK